MALRERRRQFQRNTELALSAMVNDYRSASCIPVLRYRMSRFRLYTLVNRFGLGDFSGGETAMRMFFLGMMVAYTPSLLFLAIMLWRLPEGGLEMQSDR
jgi:hypothetical protein